MITDGEQRRNVFASQIVQAADGFEAVAGNEVDWFRLDGSVERSPVTVAVTGKIRRRRFFCAGELAYLRTRTAMPVKATVPSPTMYAYYWAAGHLRRRLSVADGPTSRTSPDSCGTRSPSSRASAPTTCRSTRPSWGCCSTRTSRPGSQPRASTRTG